MQLSATKCTTYEMCPQKYNYTHVIKLLQLPSQAMDIGTTYHDCLEAYHNDAGLFAIEEMVKDKYGVDSLQMTVSSKKQKIKKADLILGMLDKYYQNPIIGDVVENEQKIEIEIANVRFTGKVDRVDVDKIVEYKTSSFDYKDEHVNTIQTDAYIYYFWKTTGTLLPMVYSINNKSKFKNKKYNTQVIRVERTEQDMVAFEKKVLEISDKITKKQFPPQPGTHCYWCQFGRKTGDGCCVNSL